MNNTLTLNDKTYSALESEALRTGRPVVDLVTEAIETWLADAELGEAELSQNNADEQEVRDCRQLFNRLSKEWRRGRSRGVDVAGMVMHPSYQRIIGMGDAAIPMILNELNQRPDHWFWALHSITGANPATEDSQGDLRKMTSAWLEWGRANGYACQTDVD